MNNAGGERGLACCGHPQAAFPGYLWSVQNVFLRTAFINLGLWGSGALVWQDIRRRPNRSGDRRPEIKLNC